MYIYTEQLFVNNTPPEAEIVYPSSDTTVNRMFKADRYACPMRIAREALIAGADANQRFDKSEARSQFNPYCPSVL